MISTIGRSKSKPGIIEDRKFGPADADRFADLEGADGFPAISLPVIGQGNEPSAPPSKLPPNYVVPLGSKKKTA